MRTEAAVAAAKFGDLPSRALTELTKGGSIFRAAVLARVLEAKRAREERRKKIAAAIAAAYEPVPGDRRFCVRRLEVVEHVAQLVGETVINNAFFAEVEAVARALGWQPIRNRGRSFFRCAKRSEHDEAAALAHSRELRFDPRCRPCPALEALQVAAARS